MKIAIVSRHFPGGVGTAAWHQALLLAVRGHQVYFVSMDGCIAEFCSQARIPLLTVRRKRTLKTRMWSLCLRVPPIARRLSIFPQDVENLGFAAHEAAVLRRLVREEKIEAVFFSDSFIEAACWRAPPGCRTVMGFHGPQYQWHWIGRSNGRMKLNRGLLRLDVKAARRSDLWYAPSRFMRELAAKYYGIPQDGIAVIPNAVDVERFTPPPAGRVRRDLLFAGRFTAEKGADVLVDIVPGLLEEFPDLTFTIAGDSGPDDSNRLLAEVLIERAGRAADRVRWKRMLPYQSLPELYREACALTLPSKYDNFPMVILEAHASGVPVVASRVGGIPEVVEDGRTGLLIAAETREETRSALRRLLRNPAEREAMGRAARERAVKLWSFEAVGPQIEALLARDRARSPDPIPA
jgi:glycosyltransferase involved in cell wall biosynthesis